MILAVDDFGHTYEDYEDNVRCSSNIILTPAHFYRGSQTRNMRLTNDGIQFLRSHGFEVEQ